jgi:ABC-2 type transport system permease protein
MLASLFTNVVFGYIVAALVRAVVAERGSIDAWNARDLLTFTFGTQAMLGAIAAFGDRELGQRVVSGDIASDLVRPVSLQGWTISQFFGKSFAQIVVRMVPTFVSGMIVFELRVPNIGTALAFLVSLFLAILVASLWWMVVNLTAFWFTSPKGTVQLATIIGYSFSGIGFPLVFLPNRIESVVRWMPWASQVQFPVEVFVGKRDSLALLLSTYGRQILWAALLFGLAQVFVSRGHRKLVVQGG